MHILHGYALADPNDSKDLTALANEVLRFATAGQQYFLSPPPSKDKLEYLAFYYFSKVAQSPLIQKKLASMFSGIKENEDFKTFYYTIERLKVNIANHLRVNFESRLKSFISDLVYTHLHDTANTPMSVTNLIYKSLFIINDPASFPDHIRKHLSITGEGFDEQYH